MMMMRMYKTVTIFISYQLSVLSGIILILCVSLNLISLDL